MAKWECIAQLGGWEGYVVAKALIEERDGERWCVIRLRPKARTVRCCSGYGPPVRAIHDSDERRVRDLPIFEAPVELIVPRLRPACPRCGPKLEQLSWLEPYARVSARLAASVARMCQVMSIRHLRVRRVLADPGAAPNPGHCATSERLGAPRDLVLLPVGARHLQMPAPMACLAGSGTRGFGCDSGVPSMVARFARRWAMSAVRMGILGGLVVVCLALVIAWRRSVTTDAALAERASRPDALRDAELVYLERLFRTSKPVGVVAKLTGHTAYLLVCSCWSSSRRAGSTSPACRT